MLLRISANNEVTANIKINCECGNVAVNVAPIAYWMKLAVVKKNHI